VLQHPTVLAFIRVISQSEMSDWCRRCHIDLAIKAARLGTGLLCLSKRRALAATADEALWDSVSHF
jgi:hypothetical protein